jgi:hypothetical protein
MGADAPTKQQIQLDANVLRGLEVFGVSAQCIDALRAREKQEANDFEVYGDCWESVMFFLMVQTQWIYCAAGWGARRAGLNFSGIESALRISGTARSKWSALFIDLKEIETAVLLADQEKADR